MGLDLVAGLLAGAGGNALGGLAAQSIFGKPITDEVDTSIPNITAATILPKTKSGPAETVPQVNAQQALDWIDQGAQQQQSDYMQGLKYYTQAIGQAATAINAGYKTSDATLQPLNFAATSALNEEMRMMGLDPIQPTATLGSQLRNNMSISNDIVPGSTDYANQLADLMDKAATLKDPNERADAKAQIDAMLTQGQQSITAQNYPGQIAAVQSSLAPFVPLDYNSFIANQRGSAKAKNQAYSNAYNTALNQYNARAQADINSQKDAITLKQNESQVYSTELDSLKSQFDLNYAPTYDAGYTGAQVAQKIQQTPGYQAEVDAGTQAINRQAAANGDVLSGNTGIALQQYGQQTALKYYNQYMTNLGNIVTQGSPATLALAKNDVGEGQDYAQLYNSLGQAGQATYNSIGESAAAAANNKAQTAIQVAEFNANLQQQRMLADINQQTAETTASMGASATTSAAQTNSAPAAAMAQLQFAKFDYGVAQNQQAGQVFSTG